MRSSVLVLTLIFCGAGCVLLLNHLHHSSVRESAGHRAARDAIPGLLVESSGARVLNHVPLRPQLAVPDDVIDSAPTMEVNPTKVLWLPSTTNKTAGRVLADDGVKVGWQVISATKPRAMRVFNVLTDDECEDLVAYATKFMARSQVISHNFDGKSEVNPVRTSTGMFMSSTEQREHPVNKKLHAHARAVLGIPDDSWIEATQILRYEAGQFYRPHTDYFDVGDAPNLNRGGQRLVTMLTWLNDVKTGGSTSFPLAQPKPVFAAPAKGQAVLFYDVDEQANPDIHSTHGGEPPEPGSYKWVAVLWCHGRTFV